jgi:hypothetical protein
MPRSILAALAAAAAALAFAACGSDDTSGASRPSTASLKASVEQAAHVKLVASPIPAQAREQGLTASFSNEADVAKDKQVVFLFVVKDDKTAGKVSEQVRGMVPGGSKLIVDDNVIVLYASEGQDRGADIEQAVKAL